MDRTTTDRTRRIEDASRSAAGVSFRAVILPCGTLLPIEARLGRRLLRRIAPDSDEGRSLLERDQVELIDPCGMTTDH